MANEIHPAAVATVDSPEVATLRELTRALDAANREIARLKFRLINTQDVAAHRLIRLRETQEKYIEARRRVAQLEYERELQHGRSR